MQDPASQTLTDVQKTRLLNPQMAAAAVLIGRSSRHNDAARLVGVKRDTLATWTSRPDFQLAVAEANRVWIAELIAEKGRIIEQALKVEEATLKNKKHPRQAAYAHEIAMKVVGQG
jgi:hypothetical protein